MNHHQSIENCKNLARMVDQSFKRQFKFEGSIVSAVNTDGSVNTVRGYGRTLSEIGSTSTQKPSVGDSILQMSTYGGAGMPFSLGPSDWISG